jgi:hypothetical protein
MLSTRRFGSACAVAVFVCLMAAPVSAQSLVEPAQTIPAAAGTGATRSARPDGATYTWSGELVSVDATAGTMTVKSRVAYQDAVSELKQFKPGEPVWVVWSGLRDYSDAVRQVRRFEANRKIDEDLVLPAELVSTEAPNQYVSLRVKVPASELAAIKAVKPGEWIIVTSRHRPSTDAEAVVTVKPYGSSVTTN